MQSKNRSDIPRDIEKGKGEGRYKECFQLALGVAGDRYSFYTSCNKNGLEYSGVSSTPHATLGVQLQPRCPTDCHFFQDAKSR